MSTTAEPAKASIRVRFASVNRTRGRTDSPPSECFGRMAPGMAAYEVNEQGKRIDYDFAEKLSRGDSAGAAHASFSSDVMVEAAAEVASDGRSILPEIAVPLLLVGGSPRWTRRQAP